MGLRPDAKPVTMSTSGTQAATFTFDDAVRQLRAGDTTADEAAERLIAQLTDWELLWLLDGDTPVRDLVRMVKKLNTVALTGGALPRLGIPGVRFIELAGLQPRPAASASGPRGAAMNSVARCGSCPARTVTQVADRSRLDTSSAASADASNGLFGEPVDESREDGGQPHCRRHDP